MAEAVICKFCRKAYLEPCDETKKTNCPNFLHRLAHPPEPVKKED